MDNYKVLEVTHIESGERIKIKDYRFNPALHKEPKVIGEMKRVGKESVYKTREDVVDLGKLDNPESPALEVAVEIPVEEAQEAVEEPESDEEEEVEGVENYCEACDKTFKRPQDLKTHNKRFHGEEVDEEEGS